MYIADVAHASLEAIVSMSPAELLAQSDAVQYEIASRRDDAVAAADDRVHRLLLELEQAKHDAEFKRTAAEVAHAIINNYSDPLFERLPGDVIIRRDTELEHTVLAVRVDPGTRVLYYTVPTRQAAERHGDGAAPVWRPADEFRRP
ncbi:hypothetical protein SEA_ZETA1847_68 [Microbacterium phage Zeta1847]|uniref:Uncharacterized protein n=1 Tax=Microbacterium phage Zeta1847 TaxID=2201444 RepID=A0A2Z4Q9F6_9CAUD|nr:hypothetical protein HOT46_gp68 [Microbacterium phage Zeta1847]AWY06702.1 hypothetical protein SEA_ZETA1847_68 [Microbacterium phage Zeta1847]